MNGPVGDAVAWVLGMLMLGGTMFLLLKVINDPRNK